MSFKPILEDAEAAMIGKMLQYNRTLTRLDLSTNEITDKGAKAIAQGLTFNR
jgi:Leucine Rich repeat